MLVDDVICFTTTIRAFALRRWLLLRRTDVPRVNSWHTQTHACCWNNNNTCLCVMSTCASSSCVLQLWHKEGTSAWLPTSGPLISALESKRIELNNIAIQNIESNKQWTNISWLSVFPLLLVRYNMLVQLNIIRVAITFITDIETSKRHQHHFVCLSCWTHYC